MSVEPRRSILVLEVTISLMSYTNPSEDSGRAKDAPQGPLTLKTWFSMGLDREAGLQRFGEYFSKQARAMCTAAENLGMTEIYLVHKETHVPKKKSDGSGYGPNI
jgi:hypothetical protein